jgi:hypothetical protein
MTSFTWYQCGLNIGKHTVQIQYYPPAVGNTANLRSRLLKIDVKSGKIVPPPAGPGLEDELSEVELEEEGIAE